MNDKELLDLILTDIHKSSCDLEAANLAQVHAAINTLTKANISFNLSFTQGTTTDPPYFTLTVNLTPTVGITITFQLGEGGFII
ncbi:hypothetical protein [Vallitalea okinawensis]|uniref:hypothetical protein n=1 Tax=Vallitalea okinawensis TaxID=2078660 RepID=UPI000CFDEEF9|nr:hypothetical protein [Vallitalea okinawensis]